eukprot:13661819-Alexandrium_andersonii.AAC.1
MARLHLGTRAPRSPNRLGAGGPAPNCRADKWRASPCDMRQASDREFEAATAVVDRVACEGSRASSAESARMPALMDEPSEAPVPAQRAPQPARA